MPGVFSVGTIVANLHANTTSYIRGMNRVDLTTKATMARVSRTVVSSMKVVSVAMAAVGVAAIKVASDFETSFTGVRKTVDATEGEFARLEASFRQLSKEIPASINEINRVGEAAGQLGIKKENIVAFTKTMLDLGVATNLSADEAATALARFANITGMAQTDFDRLGSTIVELGNNFATTEAEIVTMSLRLAGAGAQIGLAEADILGLAAALSSVGVMAELGGSAVSRIMLEMNTAVISGSDELKTFAKTAGVSVDEFKKLFKEDAADAILTFVEGMAEVKAAGGDMTAVLKDLGLTGIRITDVTGRLTGANKLLRRALNSARREWVANDALTKEVEKKYKTFAAQLTIVWNIVKDYALTIGNEILPLLKDWLMATRELDKEHQDFAETLKITGQLFAAMFITISKAVRGWALGMATLFKGVQLMLFSVVTEIIKGWSLIGKGIQVAMNFGSKVILTAFNGWKIIVKTFELVFLAVETAIVGMFKGMSEGIQEAIDFAIEKINVLIEAYNKLPDKLKLFGEIEALANVDVVFKDTLDSLREQTGKANKELVGLLSGETLNKDIKDFALKLDLPFDDFVDTLEKTRAKINEELGALEARLAAVDMFSLGGETAKEALEKAGNDFTAFLAKFDNATEELNRKRNENIAKANADFAEINKQTLKDNAALRQENIDDSMSAFQQLFGASKAFAIADSIISIQQAIAKASASGPFPWNLGAMATVAAATASIISTIKGTNPSFLGGGDTPSGPRTGGVDGKGGFPAILHPNERVTDLVSAGTGNGSGDIIFNYTNNFQAGSDGNSIMQALPALKRMIKQGSLETIKDARRRGVRI